MATYLYCFLPRGAEPPRDVAGIGGERVRVISCGDLEAWVSDLAGAMPAAEELARGHDAVVRAAMRCATPLPARGGQRFRDDHALRRSVVERGAHLAGALATIDGMVEMTVRILLQPGASSTADACDASPGTAHLVRLLGRQRAAAGRRDEADFLHEQVGRAVDGLVSAAASGGARLDRGTVVISHLVPSMNVARYRAAIQGWHARHPRRSLMLSGPWAPYGFAADFDD